MTRRRQPSVPPDLAGYAYGRLLGMGGFADVFLYRQELPARDVAVKVLLASQLDDETREQFVTEANLMAQVSQHPAIVTVHSAGFADDGRPYLVMEYCSRPGVAERYRVEQMSVAECLRIAVRIASAVAAAHAVGIWHRDVKPANVLTTDYGWPALTDFGIAATAARAGSAAGMSVPWAPPELLSPDPSGDERSDVYSLAATLYSMLAGRSPFEVPGTDNTVSELVGRIERMPLPQIGRSDVPDDLFEVLAQAMSKHIEDRQPSAVTFARELQQVEAAMGLSVTALDLGDPTVPDETVGPGPLALVGAAAPSATGQGGGARTAVPDDAPELDEPDDVTRVRSVLAPSAVPVPRAGRPSAALRAGVVVAAVVVLVVVVVAVSNVLRRPDAGSKPTPSSFVDAPVDQTTVVPAPTGLTGIVADGVATFTWTNPDPAQGDRYQWAQLELATPSQRAVVGTTSVSLPVGPGGQVCVEVSILRADGRLSADPAQGCVP